MQPLLQKQPHAQSSRPAEVTTLPFPQRLKGEKESIVFIHMWRGKKENCQDGLTSKPLELWFRHNGSLFHSSPSN